MVFIPFVGFTTLFLLPCNPVPNVWYPTKTKTVMISTEKKKILLKGQIRANYQMFRKKEITNIK